MNFLYDHVMIYIDLCVCSVLQKFKAQSETPSILVESVQNSFLVRLVYVLFGFI